MGCADVVFSHGALLLVCGEQPVYTSLANSLCYLGIPVGPLWPTTQLEVTQVWYWRLHLVTRAVQLALGLPIVWRFHLDHL